MLRAIAVAAVAVVAVALAGWQPARAADDSGKDGKDQSAVQPASYTTGKIGSRLKWMGARRATTAVKPTQCVTPEDACGPSCGVQPAQELQPLSEEWSKSLGKSGKPPEGELAPLPNGNAMTSPLIEKQLATRQHGLKGGCPSPKDLKHIGDLNTSLATSEGELPHDCPLGDDIFPGRCFAPVTFTWTASQLCHKPLYFEDVQLERYGHMAGPWVQPFASAANFFCTFPILPYKMGLELPNECVYTLGYYRPGDCAPYLFDPLPISIRGLFFEANVWVASCALFP